MNAETADLLRAVAALVNHAQARPTDGDGLTRLRKTRAAAEVAWVQAGSPDLPTGTAKPTAMPAGIGTGEPAEKDWTREDVEVEVKRLTERAALLDDGNRAFWCPLSVCDGAAELGEGGVGVVSVPRWVLP